MGFQGRKRNVNSHDESSPNSVDIYAHIINIHMLKLTECDKKNGF